ncbi:zonular occludens toxin domain-containing protein [Pontibacterium granulatum]|uniref:zonular occludens toxin domain-containing protein n=1 Tax=Pontibacterium granulatum TaxID=2036029 RepID=UPI00249A3417|nr:zonular occludens toxin domain-containing protein [Pontibacterium granulatum]MDI3323922.1 zonular occludens toxin domain-containing protein [Pontibacterium granulatum]
MFMFMEGLPGAGKSYEAAVYYIAEELKKGRPVDAYIEGLNHDKFAEVTAVPLDELKTLLIQITREQVREIYKHARKDALVVIDEMQNFWPKGRQTLSDEMTKFVTEHRHEGQDIIGMGQDINDVHNIWRNRCAKKFVMQTQDMVGRPNKYTWTAYQGKRTDKGIKFVKIKSGTRTYEEKYFGLYKSHSDGTSNFDTFEDDRTNLLKSKKLILGVPATLGIAGYAVWYLATTIFSGTGVSNKEALEAVSNKPATVQTSFQDIDKQFNQVDDVAPGQIKIAPEPTATPLPPAPVEPIDYVDEIATKYRLRLAGMAVTHDGRRIIQIQALDTTLHLKELFREYELEALGWEVIVKPYGVLLVKGDVEHIVRQWPIDPFGQTNRHTGQRL